MYSKNKYSYTYPLLFSIAVAVGMLIGYKLHSNMPISKSFFTTKEKNSLDEVLDIIQKRYVDKVNTDSTEELAIQTVLSSLDPHSNYIPASALMEMNEDIEGQFEGIGVEFNIFSDTVHLLSVLKNGPSAKAGLNIGDKIIKVDDSSAIGIKNSDQFKKWVKGPSGSVVNLTILRNGKLISKDIIRGNIPISSVDAAYMIKKETGYIRLNRFSANTYREFMIEMEKLNTQGIKNLIIDLRDNGGGLLDEAVNIADEFISGDKLIVYTEGINSPRKDYKAKRPGIFETGKVIILLNESSASASEVLAGALQDHDRATIMGRKSFGKGLVQEQFSLSDGSALRLTTARYYTPLGRSIQKSYSEGAAKYHQNFINRINNSNADSSLNGNSKVFKTSGGKILYERDGITPDIIVERDKITYDTLIFKLYENNLIGNFSYRKFINEKEIIGQLNNPEALSAYLSDKNKLMDELISFARNQGIILPVYNEQETKFIHTRILAQIARISCGDNAYFNYVNKNDNTFKMAVESF
jgi:carboxyl-terminal processing protease